MDRSLIIGASGGIGAAIADALPGEVVRLSRSRDGLDVTDGDSVAGVLGALEGPFDRIVLATGILAPEGGAPEKAMARVEAGAMAQVLAVNAIGPALVLGQVPRLLPKEGRAVVAVLTARVGSIGDNRIGGWISYRAAKAAVNQIVHTAAIELGRTHREAICVALHPGTVKTAFTEKYLGRHPAVAAEEAARNLLSVMDGLGGDQTGGFYDWAGKEVAW